MNRGAALIGLLAIAAAYFVIRPAAYAAVVSSAGVLLFLSCLKAEYRRDMEGRALFAVVAMPLIAWSLPNIWLLYIVMGFWVPLLAGRRERLVGVYLFTLLLLPPLDIAVTIGSLRLFELGVLKALGLGAAFAIWRSSGRRSVPLACDGWVAAMLMVFCFAWSRDTAVTNYFRNGINIALSLGLPYYILSRGVRSMDELRTAMRWFACGGMALSTELIFETVRVWPIYNQLYDLYGVPINLLIHTRGGLLRPGGPFLEATSVAMVLAMCLTAMLLLRRDFRSNLHHMALLVVNFIGLSVPQSRGAWIGFFLSLAATELFRKRYRALLTKVVMIGCSVALVFAVAHSSVTLQDSLGLSGGSKETSDYRRRLFTRGQEEFWHSPIIGFSTPELEWRLADMRQGEGIIDLVNTYLWIALVSGATGLSVFFCLFGNTMRRLWRMRRRLTDPSALDSAAFAFGCLVMQAEMLFFTSFGDRPAILLFGVFGFAAALFTAARVPAVAPAMPSLPSLPSAPPLATLPQAPKLAWAAGE
ncbi:O-antigen ligase family protein [Novosphingobium sp. BL-8A]|uniref:O-antigen ligase family protein n=1 Tax=Novosphingobium sp. BL-8A TaxID=3127639 RepID=UPI003756EA84